MATPLHYAHVATGPSRRPQRYKDWKAGHVRSCRASAHWLVASIVAKPLPSETSLHHPLIHCEHPRWPRPTGGMTSPHLPIEPRLLDIWLTLAFSTSRMSGCEANLRCEQPILALMSLPRRLSLKANSGYLLGSLAAKNGVQPPLYSWASLETATRGELYSIL